LERQSSLWILIAPSVQGQPQAGTSSGVANADVSASLEATARLVSQAVVEILATAYVVFEGILSNAADLVTRQRASGSGVIVDAEGFIVTNAQVVRGAQRVRVNIRYTFPSKENPPEPFRWRRAPDAAPAGDAYI
jgi:S1-C subfamily serine protease